MVIPITTRNKAGAEEWMNFVYDKANYAELIAYVQYVPVLSDITAELRPSTRGGGQPAGEPAAGGPRQAQDLAGAVRRGRRRVRHIYADVTGE